MCWYCCWYYLDDHQDNRPDRMRLGLPCVVHRLVPFLPVIEELIRDSDDIHQMVVRVYFEVSRVVDGWSCYWFVDNGRMELLFVFWELPERHLCDDGGDGLPPMSWIENCELRFRRNVFR